MQLILLNQIYYEMFTKQTNAEIVVHKSLRHNNCNKNQIFYWLKHRNDVNEMMQGQFMK